MKVKEDIKRTYVANDGKEFENKNDAENHEMKEYRKTIKPSSKYILGRIQPNGSGWFEKYKRREYSNRKISYLNQGNTSNIKYAYKFSTFEDAYNTRKVSNYYIAVEILTLEDATAASNISKAQNAIIQKKEQRYVCEYDKDPTESGKYITSSGMGHCYVKDGEDVYWDFDYNAKPEFWMRKINKTAR